MKIAKVLLECLEMIENPRASYNRKYHFMDIMTIVILSVISGADTWDDMEN